MTVGRGDTIQRYDLLNPIQVRYRTALRPLTERYYNRLAAAAQTGGRPAKSYAIGMSRLLSVLPRHKDR